MLSAFEHLDPTYQDSQSYPTPNSINNEASTALMILAGICNQNWHFWVLVKDLLNAAVVDIFAWILLTCDTIVGFLWIT